jgi:wyosine [tRNA(Phe)-imidazoG37] synthetase (radical SAM superfamily)
MSTTRTAFFSPVDLVEAVRLKLDQIKESGEHLDYLTIVPDGEPTLDSNLGELIGRLKTFSLPIAVITNGTLIWDKDVQDALLLADWVSLKVDAISDQLWRRIDRPHKLLDHGKILGGMRRFSERWHALGGAHQLMTETMLVEGENTHEDELKRLSSWIGLLHPSCAYLSIPTRPPSVSSVRPANESSLARAYALYSNHVAKVEYLIGYEGNAFSNSGDSREDVLSITAVHPMREDAVKSLLERNGGDFSVIEQLVTERLVSVSHYGGETFYVRDLTHARNTWGEEQRR